MAIRAIAETVLRLAVAGVFLYAGAVKAWDSQQFALDVQNYQLTSWTGSILVAFYLPWLELFCAVALVVRRLVAGALVLLGGMLIVFLGAITSAWVRGLDISCGCFASGERSIQANYPALAGMDLALLGAVGWLLLCEWRRK